MQTINLNLYQKTIIPVLCAKQGDVDRKFKAVITDGGEGYQIPAGAVFSVWYSGACGEGNYTAIGGRSAFVVDGNTVTVELITQMLANAGAGLMCLVMNSVDGSQLATWNIPYVAECLPGAGSAAAQQYYTAFSENVQRAEAAAVRAEQAAVLFDGQNADTTYPNAPGIYRTVGVNIFKNLPLAGDQLYGVLVIFEAAYALHIYVDTYSNLFWGRSGDTFEEPDGWSSVAKSQLLWRNASPGSGFGAQTIPLDLTKVSNIMVTSIYGTIIVTKNQLGVMNFHDPTDVYTRTIEASDNGVTIGDCIRNGSEVSNGIMIPQNIYSWG